MARTVAGIFPDRRSAEHAIVDLKADGFDPQRMGIVMRDRSDAREVAEDQGVSSTAGAVTGGVVGGTAGALLAATGALAIPGVGPFITGGVLASLVGGTAGWLVGGLAGLGLSRDEAQYYQNRVEQGGVLVTVDPDGREMEARRIMIDNGAEAMQPQGGVRGVDSSVGDDISRQAAPTRPAMDEDIIQGRRHGTVGDEDVVRDHRDERRVAPHIEAVDDRNQRLLDK